MNNVDKILNEIEKQKDTKRKPSEQHPYIIESRKHWGWDAGYDNYDPTKNEKKEK